MGGACRSPIQLDLGGRHRRDQPGKLQVQTFWAATEVGSRLHEELTDADRLSDGLLLFENVAPKPGQELRADLAFTPLNLEAITKDIHASGIAPDEAVTLFSGYAGVIEQPNVSDTYAFISWIDQSFVPHLNALDFSTFAEYGMKYIGDDDEGLHQFRVAGNHKGDAYKGCSGSPIINQYGKVVSLVKRGDQEAGIIYGYPFGPFLPVVDEILADQLPPK